MTRDACRAVQVAPLGVGELSAMIDQEREINIDRQVATFKHMLSFSRSEGERLHVLRNTGARTDQAAA